jgi:4-hydroxy-3-polyprenylbenzoate decarboxylase
MADDMGNVIGNVAAKGAPRLDNELRIPYEDLRDWIAEAEKLGEVKHVKGASWERDIGMAAEVVLHEPKAPCVVFEDIPGSLKGSRVLVNFFSGKRMNMTLGFPSQLNKIQLTDAFHRNYMKDLKLIPPKYVASGPVMENVLEGEAIDVEKFPTPLWHEEDGGRYIGTGSFNVTKDPDTGWINLGTYRVMIHDKKSVGFYISPGKHGRVHRDKYAQRKEPMPALIVIGGDILTFLMGCSEVPPGVCEYDVVGGFRGKPIEVIKGKHTGLPFPANAEIVLEGFVHPDNMKEEGPFGEWTGYYGSKMRREPVLDIKAIYHRNNPIILGCPPQRPPDELARYRAVTRSALLKENIAKAGVPDVTAAWLHEVGTARMLIGVSVKQRYPGHSKQAGHVACQCHVGAYAGKYVIVTDDDIDVSNLEELIWAMLTRSDPAESIDIIHGAWSTPLDPRIPPWEKEKGNMTNSRAIIDACRPFHWRNEFPPVNAPSPELARESREKWGWLCE